MKRKIIGIILLVIAVSSVVGGIWYNSPVDFVRLSADDVLEIVVFDGNTGKTIHISEKDDIDHLLSNWNEVTLKRDKISTSYTGYSFRTIIYLNDGEPADGWNNFIINSNDTIRKDPFFYKTTNVLLDYEYINDLFDVSRE